MKSIKKGNKKSINLLGIEKDVDSLSMAGVSNSWASGGHIACWQSCRGPHDVFDLEITTSPGNSLGNVARSEVDLQKKRHYLSSISTSSLFFRNRVLWHEVELIFK